MIIHCIKKLADSWKVPLQNIDYEDDKSDCWNLTCGNYNRKRYYILAHELTMWSMLLFELNPRNFEKKVSDKLQFWSKYYGFPDLSETGIFNTKKQIFCKNKDRSITGMMARFKEDLWYHFNSGDELFKIELMMHKWIFLPVDKYPIENFIEFVNQKI